jgi:hypothetical protein
VIWKNGSIYQFDGKTAIAVLVSELWSNALGRAPSGFTAATSQMGPGSNPWTGTANHAFHPSGVGKLVAAIGSSIQWVTTVEGSEG